MGSMYFEGMVSFFIDFDVSPSYISSLVVGDDTLV